MVFRRAMLTLAAVLLVPPVIHSQPPQGIRGFTVASADGERTVERQFRAIPIPERLREYMQAITEEPHHAGSPGSRKVAEYIVGKFKSWGLDARIGRAKPLPPSPVGPRPNPAGRGRFPAPRKEPPIAADKDSGDEGQLPTFNAYSADGD